MLVKTEITHIKNNLYEMDIEYDANPLLKGTHLQTGIETWLYNSKLNKIFQHEVESASTLLYDWDIYDNNFHLVVASSKPLWRWWVHSGECTWENSMVPQIITCST